ncbi:MAG: hypothetical protein AB1458_15915 [Bacteroidota bacterium]
MARSRTGKIVLSLFIAAALTTTILSWNGCAGGLGKKTEGTVLYDVTYPYIKEDNIMATGLPKEAKYVFKKKFTLTDITGMMGFVRVQYIADNEKKTVKQTLDLFQKLYISEMDEKEVKARNAEFLRDITEVPGEVKEIAGYECKKARATLASGTVIDVYYTDQLGYDNINWSNPYSKLKGVLMEFQVEKYGLTMRLVAKSVTLDPVDDSEFTPKGGDFKKIPIQDMEDMLRKINPITEEKPEGTQPPVEEQKSDTAQKPQ